MAVNSDTYTGLPDIEPSANGFEDLAKIQKQNLIAAIGPELYEWLEEKTEQKGEKDNGYTNVEKEERPSLP